MFVVVVLVVVVAGSEGDTTVVITVTALSRSSPPSIRKANRGPTSFFVLVVNVSNMLQCFFFICFLIFLMDVSSCLVFGSFDKGLACGSRVHDYFQECGISNL